MSNPSSLATLDVLTKLGPPSLQTDANLFSWSSVGRSISASRAQTVTAPCFAYVGLAWSPDRASATTIPDFDSAGSAMTWSNTTD